MSKNKSQKKEKQSQIIQPKQTKNNNLIFGIIVFVSAFVIYSNTFKHDYVLDDYGVLKDNWIIKSGTKEIPLILKTTYRFGINHLTDGLYRPLPLVMYAIEWQISPDNPGLSHFVNVFCYALSCFLLFLFLKKLLKNHNAVFPFLISLLFSMHPIHAEVVANIKSRDEIMSFLFLMLTFILFLKYFEKITNSASKNLTVKYN